MIIVRDRYESTQIECEDSWNYHGNRVAEFHGNSLEELKAFITEHEGHVRKEDW